MKTCPNPKCNFSGIPDDAKFCPNCGATMGGSNSIKKIIYSSIIISVIGVALLVFLHFIQQQIEQQKIQQYITELAQNGPSGFREGIEDDWIYQEYQRLKNDSITYNYIIFEYLDEYYSWNYNAGCEIQLRELRCSGLENLSYHGHIIGFAHYYGPIINNKESYHKYYIKGTINNGVWVFDTCDKEGNIFDHFEGGSDNWVLSGICTNKNGVKNRFKFTTERKSFRMPIVSNIKINNN